MIPDLLTVSPPTLSSTKYLTIYTDVKLEILGRTLVNIDAFGSSKKLQLFVVKGNDIPLFGLDWVLKFKLPLCPGAWVCPSFGNQTVSPQIIMICT
jgi:hypothetical protein